MLVARYFRCVKRPRGAGADSHAERARDVLDGPAAGTRENYHMMDDEFQLPVLAARYLADTAVPADRKRRFLLDTADAGETRLALHAPGAGAGGRHDRTVRARARPPPTS